MIYKIYNFYVITELESLIFPKVENCLLENNKYCVRLNNNNMLKDYFPLGKEQSPIANYVFSNDEIRVSWGNRIIYSIKGNSVQFYKNHIANDIEISLSLNCILSIISIKMNTLPLHAACLKSPLGYTYAFSGASKAGKSTLTASLLNKKWEFISEELLLCDLLNNKVIPEVGPPYLRLEKESCQFIKNKYGLRLKQVNQGLNKDFYWCTSWKTIYSVTSLDNLIILESGNKDSSIIKASFTQTLKHIQEHVYLRFNTSILNISDYFNMIIFVASHVNCFIYKYPEYPSAEFIENHFNKLYLANIAERGVK